MWKTFIPFHLKNIQSIFFQLNLKRSDLMLQNCGCGITHVADVLQI